MEEFNQEYDETVTYRGHRATGTPGGPLCRKRARRQAVGTAKELQDREGRWEEEAGLGEDEGH